MSSVLNKMKSLNEILKQSTTNYVPLKQLCNQLCEILASNIYLFYATGEIFSYSTAQSAKCPHNDEALQNTHMPNDYIEIFNNTPTSTFNIYEKEPICTCEGVHKCIFTNRYYAMMPIFHNFNKVAGILLIRYGSPFDESEEILCEYASVIVSMEVMRQAQERIEQRSLMFARCQLAIQSLSYTELKVTAAILEELAGKDKVIVLSSISNKIYVTRSIVTSALRKLESSGAIETKSLGVKGMYIKVINDFLTSEIQKLDDSHDLK